MTGETAPPEIPSITCRVAGGAALLLLCAPFIYGAIGAFPIWDDAWIWLLLRERGVDAVAPSFADRPVNAALWSWLAGHRALFPAGFLAQATLWPLLAGVAALLWVRLYPRLRRYAAVAACLTVAPFATKVQMVTVNVALASLPPVLLAYAALLLLWRFVGRGSRAALLAAVPLLTLGVLWQEYALAAALVGSVLLTTLALGPRAIRRRALAAILVLAIVSLAAYTEFLALGDPGSRQDTRPQHLLRTTEELGVIPGRLATATWRVLGGGLVATVRDLVVATPSRPAGLLVGALLAGLLLYAISGPSRRGNDDDPRGTWIQDIALIVALAVGILPVLVMGRIPWDPADGMSSRFGLAVLPVAAAILTRLVCALQPLRLAAPTVAALALVAGSAAAVKARAAVDERQTMTALGGVLRPHVARHRQLTVAVVPLPARGMGPSRPWELVARLSAEWPVDLGRRLWAYPYGGEVRQLYDYDAGRRFGPRESCRFPSRLRASARLVRRHGRVHTLAWLAVEPDGSIVFEPYCRKP